MRIPKIRGFFLFFMGIHLMSIKTAVFVDGGFFLKRHRKTNPNVKAPHEVAQSLYAGIFRNMDTINKKEPGYVHLYRIFFYDCPPLTKRAHNPITKRAVDFSRTEEAIFRMEFHAALKRKRKTALRLGRLADYNRWSIRPEKIKELLDKKIKISDLNEFDVCYEAHQKGVDMRIGLDIAALAYKKPANQIILISGDSDFVPAAKLARREGIDFILDPMWNPINPDLHEHIDGLSSGWPNPSGENDK